ncbi:MAG: class I SAM-dependent methyltransferase [archaeon]
MADLTANNIKLKHCRICGSQDLTNYLDLGSLPLANGFVKGESEEEPRFPLEVMYCGNCGLSQLGLVVDPKILFSYYPYRSSISRTFQNHCSEMAEVAKQYFPNPKDTLVVDIASNDGCLLNEFKKKGFKVLGVDPAKNIAKIANERGIETLCEFWGPETAGKITKRGKAKIITATNVFAHVHDVNGFVANAKKALAEDGMLIFEFHYAGDLIGKTEFDTIYHEHLSYFLLRPLTFLFGKHGMRIFDARIFPVHGGALRIYAVNKDNPLEDKDSVKELLEFEKNNGLDRIETYYRFRENVEKIKRDFSRLMRKFRKEGKLVAGFGAAAKGNTLLNYCGINRDFIKFIVDETPEKQGLLYAGTKIPVKGFEAIREMKPDYIIIFPWNFSKEIISKVSQVKEFREKNGKYVIPIPEVRIVSGVEEL